MQSQPVSAAASAIGSIAKTFEMQLNAFISFRIFKELVEAALSTERTAPYERMHRNVLFRTAAPLEEWWVWMDSNHRPPPYQDDALTG